jgi:hypothetical protein
MDLVILLILLSYAGRTTARRRRHARKYAREDFSRLPYLAAQELFPKLLRVWREDPSSHSVTCLAEEFAARVRLCETCALGTVTTGRAFEFHALSAMLENAWRVELVLPENERLGGKLPLYALAATKR